MYNDTRANVSALLDDVEYLALTTDMWSSCNMMPYMSVTAHYAYTADNLEEALRGTILEWKIEERKISCVTTDNGANIVVAI